MVVSPPYHRHHHRLSRDGEGSNFAGMFAFYDRLFGTWQEPGAADGEGETVRCGVDNWAIPSSLWGQLVAPLARTHREILARIHRTSSR